MAVSRSARSASRKERGFYWNLNEGSDNFEEEYEEDISLSSEGVYKVERLIDKRKIKVSPAGTDWRSTDQSIACYTVSSVYGIILLGCRSLFSIVGRLF